MQSSSGSSQLQLYQRCIHNKHIGNILPIWPPHLPKSNISIHGRELLDWTDSKWGVFGFLTTIWRKAVIWQHNFKICRCSFKAFRQSSQSTDRNITHLTVNAAHRCFIHTIHKKENNVHLRCRNRIRLSSFWCFTLQWPILLPFCLLQHEDKPYCHKPCYSALFGPKGEYAPLIKPLFTPRRSSVRPSFTSEASLSQRCPLGFEFWIRLNWGSKCY